MSPTRSCSRCMHHWLPPGTRTRVIARSHSNLTAYSMQLQLRLRQQHSLTSGNQLNQPKQLAGKAQARARPRQASKCYASLECSSCTG